MERTLIAPGVHLSCDPAEKFNRCRISIHFAFPAQRATATAHALLPLVLERGYADCPDMTLLTKKLAKLYGADLTVAVRTRAVEFSLEEPDRGYIHLAYTLLDRGLPLSRMQLEIRMTKETI